MPFAPITDLVGSADQGRKALKRLTLLLVAHYLDPEETERTNQLHCREIRNAKPSGLSHLHDFGSGSVQLHPHLYGDVVVDLWTVQFVVDRLAVQGCEQALIVHREDFQRDRKDVVGEIPFTYAPV